MLPQSGDVLVVGKAASVQFTHPILFRVIRVLDIETYEGCRWLEGYELNNAGDAVERRQIFVQVAGLRMAQPTQPVVPRRRPTNIRSIPAQNTRDVYASRTAAGVPQRNTSRHG